MRSFAIILIVLMLHCSLWCAITLADGGRLVMSEQHGDCRISVFTSPEPLRAGTVDISVFLQGLESEHPIGGAQVYLKLTPRDGRSQAILATATTDAATNKLLYASIVDLPQPGWWDVDISGTANKRPIHASFAIEAGERSPRWLTVWPWFCWPIGVVLLFGVHRLLVSRKQAARFDQIAP